MQTFRGSAKDKDILSQAKDKQFIESCFKEFGDKPIPTTNRQKVRLLNTWSYFPSLVSITTACFFVIYLLQDYSFIIQMVLGALLCGVAVSLEFGKRGLIQETAKGYFIENKIKPLLLIGCVVLIAASMGASYIGGNKLVVSNASPPPIEKNPTIDSLNTALASLNKSIATQEGTKWKGAITRDANKNLKGLYSARTTLSNRISKLEDQDQLAYSATLDQHTSKIGNFGLILGLIAVLSDAVLFCLIWAIKRLKNEVKLLISTRQEGTTVTVSKANISNIQPTIDSFSSNEIKQPDRPKIGFKIPSNGERLDGERITVSVDSSKQRECKHCGELFTYKHWNAQYCSDACRVAAWERRNNRKFRKKNKSVNQSK